MPPWDPTAQQTVESDTLWKPDLTSQATFNAGGGLFENTNNQSQATAASNYNFGTGRHGPAIRPNGNPGSFLLLPVDGVVPGDEGTFEVQVKHDTLNLQALQDKYAFHLFTQTLEIPIRFSPTLGNGLDGTWTIWPAAAAPTRVTKSLNVADSFLNFAAGTWVSFALSWIGGTWRLYIENVLAATITGFNPSPQVTDRLSHSQQGGLRLGGHTNGPSGLWISDPRLSRTARTPGQTPTLRSLNGSIVINTTDTNGVVPENMVGGLHHFADDRPLGEVEAVVDIMRTDKIIHPTPMKAGAPDATRPTLGHSGLYSYDFTLVDRWADMLADRGLKAYLGVNGTPQLLGGSVAPLSPASLATAYSWDVPQSSAKPNDTDAWLVIAEDVLRRFLSRGVEVPMVFTLNEPDMGTSTWNGTRAEYMAHLEATAVMIRSVLPDTKIIAGELTFFIGATTTWVNEIVQLRAGGAPIDGVSLHDYNADMRIMAEARILLNEREAANGLIPGTLELVSGEFNHQFINMDPASADIRDIYAPVRAFGAAYTTSYYICNLNGKWATHLTYSHISRSLSPRSGGYQMTQMIGVNGEHWAGYNAMKGLKMVLGPVGSQTLGIEDDDLPPGVYGLKVLHPDGTIGLAFSSYGWANYRDTDLTIDADALTGRIRRWLVDPTHSSRWDTFEDDPAGAVDQELELVSDTTGSVDGITVTVPQWGSVFMLVEPNPPSTISFPRLVRINGQVVGLGGP